MEADVENAVRLAYPDADEMVADQHGLGLSQPMEAQQARVFVLMT